MAADEDCQLVFECVGVDGIVELQLDLGQGGITVLLLQYPCSVGVIQPQVRGVEDEIVRLFETAEMAIPEDVIA